MSDNNMYMQTKQEVFSKKIIVEANRGLLTLNKDSGIAKESKMVWEWGCKTQEGPKCLKNGTAMTYIGTEMTCAEIIRARNVLSLFG